MYHNNDTLSIDISFDLKRIVEELRNTKNVPKGIMDRKFRIYLSLNVPEDAYVNNVDLELELETVVYYTKESENKEDKKIGK